MDPDYIQALVNGIRKVFVTQIVPHNVLHVFHSYDLKVLTERDIERVKADQDNKGPQEGAATLLTYLPKYGHGWFDCLLKVLRDPSVRQAHTADVLEKIKDEIDREYQHNIAEVPNRQRHGQDHMTFTSTQEQTFPKKCLNPSDSSIIADCATLSNEEYLDVDSKYPPIACYSDYCGIDSSDTNSILPKQETTKSKPKVTSDYPERNFTQEEVANALRDIQGWHENIEDREVLKLFKNQIEAGSFIIWYWKTKKRPAICVLHEGEIKTLIVHKRTDHGVSYFIDKEYKLTNLKKLVEHHLETGVTDMSKTSNRGQIEFKRPL